MHRSQTNDDRWMDRREMLKRAAYASAWSLGAAAMQPIERAAADEPVRPSKLIDTHTHFFDPTRPEGVPWPGKDSPLYRRTRPEDYRRIAVPLGVTGTVVVEASPWLEDNQWLLDLAADDPFLVGIVGNLDPHGEEFAQQLARFAKNRLFRGIRIRASDIARLDDRPIAGNLRRLAEADREVDLLGGAPMLPDALRLAKLVPTLRIVIDHLPFDMPADDDARRPLDEAMRGLADRPNVWIKVSNVLREVDGRTPVDLAFYAATLDELWRRFGDERVIYGSNWPVSDRFAPYSDVQRVVMEYVAAKGQESADRYFWKNSLTAYKWIDRVR